MKLSQGIIIRVKNRTYRGEIPDALVDNEAKKLIEDHEKKIAKKSSFTKKKTFGSSKSEDAKVD